ncbi:MAG: ribosome small subunit-dependent GTPase A [Sphingomonadales bacterium]|nr:ribosome small subunit-dependent GTPase A [Sphingomonadales bacterium]
MIGIVTKSTGSLYEVDAGQGQTLKCRLRGKIRLDDTGKTNPVAVGDHVRIHLNNHEETVITEILPRTNHIIRKATNLSRQHHVLAANIDQVMIVASLSRPRVSPGFIDRCLVTCEAYGIDAVLVLNKVDHWTPKEWEQAQELTATYLNAGYPVICTSALRGDGLETMREHLQSKITLVSGFSGVGKSSLLNRLFGDLNLRTGEISKFSSKGTHTTTFAQMFTPEPGLRIIDTPGIKEWGLAEIEGYELSHHFPEFRKHIPHCHFHTCTHTHEPQCGVREAVEVGQIPQQRYKSYLSMLLNDNNRS